MITLLMRNKLQRNKAFSIKIEKDSLLFAEITGNKFIYSSIEGLNLDVGGILKEFPDLKDKEPKEIKREGIKRFREKLKELYDKGGEKEVRAYIIGDLAKFGYFLVKEMKDGSD